jgi:hypothetical protein
MGVGAGNNGGTHTLIQSANTLKKLGQEVVIIDSGSSKYTWDEILVPYLKINDVNDVKGDVIIATGSYSVLSTNNSKIKKKYWWIRGWETWKYPEKTLVEMLNVTHCKKIVNSICLEKKLKQYKIESNIIRPGHDFDKIFPLNIRKDNNKVILGGLYNQGTKRSHKRTSWIFETFKILREKYPIELYMFGSDGTPETSPTKFFKNPNIQEKNEIYNKIDIWLSPSELEGLHIAPAEAMLTECCVVGNNSKLSGTEDYLIDDYTGLVSNNDFYSFVVNVEILIKHKILRNNLAVQGRKKILELGDRKENMIKLIELLKG